MKKFIFIFFIFFISILQGQIDKRLVKLEEYVQALENRNILWREIPISGKDSSGKKVDFKVVIITQAEMWKSDNDLVLEGNREIKHVLPNFLISLPLMKKSQNIVCVGSSSLSGNRLYNIDLAKRRAENIYDIVQNYIDIDKQKTYKLCLGQFHSNTIVIDKSWQRRLIIIGTINEKNETNNIGSIRQALYNALSQSSSGLSINISDYSNFDFK